MEALGFSACRRRDLTIVNMGENSLVVACDSCGGIGEKENDVLKASPEVLGAYNARVALMEVLASGGQVISVCNTFCCEMEPTGRRVLNGMKAEFEKAGICAEIINGSTEENFVTSMTGVGVTVIGVCNTAELKFRRSHKGDGIYLFGLPVVGGEVLDGSWKAVDYDTLKKLVAAPSINEIVPVGSKGVLYEAESLGELSGLTFVPDCADKPINLKQSAGPATCVIVSAKQGPIEEVAGAVFIGYFE